MSKSDPVGELVVELQELVRAKLGCHSDGSDRYSVELHWNPPPPSRPGLEVSSYWSCETSPVGFCEYAEDDAAHDGCVHCGDPEERK